MKTESGKIGVKFLIYLLETEYVNLVCEMFKTNGITARPDLVKKALRQLEENGVEYVKPGMDFNVEYDD